ncbi:hypothetical protein F5Y15DRAFT_421814 [Xylariaceae sp. FL0016]|nr:hypothetical protein F5Y15DRAFT_421814 [Xylariaceae sp. FL0016]
MKYTAVVFTLFTALAMGEMVKVPRSQKPGKRQNAVSIQSPAMTTVNGDVVAFDAANVYKDATAKGL